MPAALAVALSFLSPIAALLLLLALLMASAVANFRTSYDRAVGE